MSHLHWHRGLEGILCCQSQVQCRYQLEYAILRNDRHSCWHFPWTLLYCRSWLFMPDWRLTGIVSRHQKSQGYIRTLGLTIIVGIYYLGLGTIGYEFSIVGLIAIVVLTSSVGFRAFYFIHPTEASQLLQATPRMQSIAPSVDLDGKGTTFRIITVSKLPGRRSLINYCVDASSLR